MGRGKIEIKRIENSSNRQGDAIDEENRRLRCLLKQQDAALCDLTDFDLGSNKKGKGNPSQLQHNKFKSLGPYDLQVEGGREFNIQGGYLAHKVKTASSSGRAQWPWWTLLVAMEQGKHLKQLEDHPCHSIPTLVHYLEQM